MKKGFAFFGYLLLIFLMLSCLSLGTPGTSNDKDTEAEISTTQTSTITKTPSPTATSTPTLTPTPIPSPVWEFYKNQNLERNEDLKSLAVDSNAFLWLTGYGGIIKWDLNSNTQQSWEPRQYPDEQFKKLIIDSIDTVWAASSKELVHFNGEEWENYIIPDKGKLNDLIEGNSKDLWLCANNGVLRFSSGEWTVFGKENGLLDDKCFAIALDPQGNPWVISQKNSLSHFNGSWENHLVPEEFLADYDNDPIPIISPNIHIDPSGKVWVRGLFQITSYDKNNWKFDLAGDQPERIDAFGLSNSGTPWVSFYQNGSTFFMAFNGTEWVNMMSPSLELGIPNTPFTTIYAAPDESMWFISQDMFIRKQQYSEMVFREAKGAWSQVHNLGYAFLPDGRLFYLASDGILELSPDSGDTTLHQGQGNLASNSIIDLQIGPGGEVLTMHGERHFDTTLGLYDGINWSSHLPGSEIRELIVGPDGTVLIPTNGGPLYKSSINLDIFTELSIDDGILDDIINTAMIDSAGNFWLGHYTTISTKSDEGGASFWNGEFWTALQCTYPNSPDCPGVYRFAESPEGAIWAIIRADKNFKTLNVFKNDVWQSLADYAELPTTIDYIVFNRWDEPIMTSNFRNTCIFVEFRNMGFLKEIELDYAISAIAYGNNTLWYGTETAGLFYRVDQEDKVGRIEAADNSLWADEVILALNALPDGTVWMGTSGGVYWFDGANWTKIKEVEEAGYIDVQFIEVAPDGTVWFGSTSQGLARFGLIQE